MFDFLFALHLAVVGAAILILLCAFALSGLAIFSRYILPRLKLGPEESVFTSAMMQAVMVFYGLAVALIAVSVWQTYTDAGATTSREATAIGVLYREMGGYPEPVRSQLRQELREYVEYIINEAWPQQRRGEVPRGGVEKVNDVEAKLVAFEPATEGQKLLHAETLRAYSQLIEARRLRLDAVLTGLPGALWFVIVLGALVSLSSTFFFHVEDALLQRIQVVLLAIFIGMIIFIIFALDRPFRGDLGLQPDSYQLIYDQLMKP
jgi:cation transport regulator ChaB